MEDNKGINYPLWLVAEGDFVLLKIEKNGKWEILIKERLDSPFSHIVEADKASSKNTL